MHATMTIDAELDQKRNIIKRYAKDPVAQGTP